jgi:hypothetical protein
MPGPPLPGPNKPEIAFRRSYGLPEPLDTPFRTLLAPQLSPRLRPGAHGEAGGHRLRLRPAHQPRRTHRRRQPRPCRGASAPPPPDRLPAAGASRRQRLVGHRLRLRPAHQPRRTHRRRQRVYPASALGSTSRTRGAAVLDGSASLSSEEAPVKWFWLIPLARLKAVAAIASVARRSPPSWR